MLVIAWFVWTLSDVPNVPPLISLIEPSHCPQKNAYSLVAAVTATISLRLELVTFVMLTALNAIAGRPAKLATQDIS